MSVDRMLCVVVVTLLLAAHQGLCQSRIRLVNGGSPQQGRVEVFVNGEWGTVCDDDFGFDDAKVICRMLGYSDVVTSRNKAYFGQGTGKIWIDQLNCKGDEESIFECDMNEFGDNDCKHKEDAGVECYRKVPAQLGSLPVRLACPNNVSCNNKATKHGPDPDKCEPSVHVEGIVEVYYNNSWQLISADSWDDPDVNVVCGQLGYPLGFGTLPNEVVPNNESNGTKVVTDIKHNGAEVIMKGVECIGTESELRLCYHYGWGPFKNPSDKVASARCGFKPHSSCSDVCSNKTEKVKCELKSHLSCEPKQPAYRLRSGVMPWQGRAEVLYSNKWGTVCDVGFDRHSCNVLCRSLGHGTCRSFTSRAGYGRGIGEVWISKLKCNGTEQWLHECEQLPWGNAPVQCNKHGGDVGVECYVPDIYEHQPEVVKLLPVADRRNPSFVNEFVEVTDSGVNGLLCYDDVDTKTLEVLCRSSSSPQFLLAHRYNVHSLYKGQRYKGNFICNGDELNIRECRPSFHPVTTCDTGDLVVHCDRGRPDLVPMLDRLRLSLHPFTYTYILPMYYLRCALEDGCLASDAADKADFDLRHLLRFDSLTMNYGIRVFQPYLDRSQWIWHACHNHYHSFEVFVAYDLLDCNETKVAEGHKASFCLEDSICDGGYGTYRCGSNVQGISVNCGDLYARHLDCQWIDITGVPNGDYILRLHVNPEQLVIESDYRNNIIQCDISLRGRRATVSDCKQSDH